MAGKQKKPGYFARHRRIAREVYAEPRSIGAHIRDGFVSVWVARGAGFYGLGWIITFVVLEIDLFTSEVIDSDGVADFLSSQLVEYALRVGVLSFVNSLMAFIWPVYVLQWMSGYGIVLLIGGYFVFERLLRPAVESLAPELAEARARASANKSRKKSRKKSKEN